MIGLVKAADGTPVVTFLFSVKKSVRNRQGLHTLWTMSKTRRQHYRLKLLRLQCLPGKQENVEISKSRLNGVDITQDIADGLGEALNG